MTKTSALIATAHNSQRLNALAASINGCHDMAPKNRARYHQEIAARRLKLPAPFKKPAATKV